MKNSGKLQLGCGHEVLEDFVNLDSSALPGVDIVHDLNKRPWPFADNQFEYILIRHVLEHLPDTPRVMEEIWRIAKPGAVISLRVPYWNAEDFITDPTHIMAFNQYTFEFFDVDKPRFKTREYYTTAKFRIIKKDYFVRILGRYLRVKSRLINWMLERLAHFLCNIIQVMEFELKVVKDG